MLDVGATAAPALTPAYVAMLVAWCAAVVVGVVGLMKTPKKPDAGADADVDGVGADVVTA